MNAVVACLALACGSDDQSDPSSTPTGAGGSAMDTAAAGGDRSVSTTPDPQYLPAATGTCPEIVDGTVTFAPAGIPERDVEIYLRDAAFGTDGPLIFYWHGTGSSPDEPRYGLGPAMDPILDAGGIIAAPFHDPDAGNWPWFLTVGSGREDDLILADEILACAIESVGVDLRRIHSVGMSAGGLQTAQMSYRRSGYVASVVSYSGGRIGDPPQQEMDNKFAAMILHGGPEDTAFIVSFQEVSVGYRDDLRGKGHFAFLCNHNLGHTIPIDARHAVGQFLADHPFGTLPSPYEPALPETFPNYCAL
jgi:predicted esterase